MSMTKQEPIEKMLAAEWEMFRSVNGDTRADCQEDRRTFELMRRAQYEAWSEEAVSSFCSDLLSAQETGRNLSREKYIRMMEHSDPVGYAAFAGELPPLSRRQRELAAAIWEKFLAQTERMRKRYPHIALGGRPLRACEEAQGGMTSVETYQVCESLTYSERTLEALYAHLTALEAAGIDLAFEIQKNTMLGLGFSSMEAAEAYMAGGRT